jgi:uncharacterized protein YfaS (alpha-2-macroglobulin family)
VNAALLSLAALLLSGAPPPDYQPADLGQRPKSGRTDILPEQFLRGYDPITVYFSGNEGPRRGDADNGAQILEIKPAWPGAYSWVDRRTLQFRPAEPWPPLRRFAVQAHGTHRVLATMMSAPTEMSPADGSDNLLPFRTFTLTFPQALPLPALEEMLKVDIRDLPGLGDSPRQTVQKVTVTQLPRSDQRQPAVYAATLDDDVPEGKQLQAHLSLALGDEDKVLWTGRLSTRPPFRLDHVQCGSAQAQVAGNAKFGKEMALACGNGSELPQLVFTANVKGLTLTELKQLVKLEPAVPDLHFESYGSRISLRGKFVPDVLYRLELAGAPIHDETGRTLEDPGEVELFFYRGWRTAFLRWSKSTAILEAHGPRMLPLTGYGDARADVRVYRVDPLFAGLWPFPDSVVNVDEHSSPPFPGEEPDQKLQPASGSPPEDLVSHLRLLGSPLVSKIVDLPLGHHSGTTRFGLDLAPLLDPVVGKNRPGTYLVGLRRLTGGPERSYLRVEITNLSLTTVEDRDRLVFFVRSLDKAKGISGAKIVLEGIQRTVIPGKPPVDSPASVELETNSEGRAELPAPLQSWISLQRLSVRDGEDVLVIDPHEPPPQFANSHWGYSSDWLQWLTQPVPAPPNEKTLAYVFTERPIYRPGETVYVKGYIRKKIGGALETPDATVSYGLKIQGPGDQSWELPFSFTPLYGFGAEFKEKDLPTGEFTAIAYQKTPYLELARRTFRVEAYRIPTFEVQLAAPEAARLDAPFQVKAVARYYAGGSVAGQPISWTVTRRPYLYVPKGLPDYLFANSAQFARPASSKVAGPITRQAPLDDKGSDSISVNPALDIDGSPRIYHFEATVTGVDNQQVSGTQEVKALPPFVLGMKLLRYSEKPITLKPSIVAVGIDDKLLAGQDVSVRLYRRVWHSQLRETNFALGQAQYVTEQEDQKMTEVKIRTADKPVTPSFDLKEAGVYVVELFARDKLGRVQTLSADLYVGGKSPVSWEKSRQGTFAVTTDQDSYAPGQTARLLIQSPFQEGHALVVIERPESNEYSWVDVSGGKGDKRIAIGENNVPNLPVHVVLMRGRLGQGEDDARFKPETVASTIDIDVRPVKNELEVKVGHPDSARPGQKINLDLTLKDDQNRPVAGEVTLWLVDEAVLSLAKEESLKPLPHFIDQNAHVSSIRDTRNQIIGALLEEDEPGGDGEGGGEGSSITQVVRKNFKTVPYYQATLTVDSSGHLIVPVTLSDDLTNFRVRAMAISGVRRFGFDQSTLHVRLPVIVQPQLPRFVRQGDRFWGGGVARLVEGAEGEGSVLIKLDGPADTTGFHKAVSLKKSQALSLLEPITVRATDQMSGLLKIQMQVTRKSDGVGDAFEMKLPVLPDRRQEHFAYFDRLKPGKVTFKPFPEEPRPGTASQQILLTSVPGVIEFAAALDYLGGYPHGCLEQRVSKLFPAVAESALLRSLGLGEAYLSQSSRDVRRLLEELPGFQDDQGLFSFWPGSAGNVELSGEVVLFLQAAQREGLPVDAKALSRAVEAMQRVLRSDYPGLDRNYAYEEQTTALRAIAEAGKLDEHYAASFFDVRSRMDIEGLADLALAMTAKPALFKDDLAALRGDLWDSVVFQLHNGEPVYERMSWRRNNWQGNYLETKTSALAAVFEGLVNLDPTNERQALLRNALLASANGAEGFGSTHDNWRALQALSAYLEKTQLPSDTTRVELGGQGVMNVGGRQKVSQTWVRSGTPLAGTVAGDPVHARISYTYLPAAAGSEVEARAQGFVVSRSMTVVHADGSNEPDQNDKAGETRKVALGDITELHTTLVSDETQYHVALVVPLPAGLEPLNPALATANADARPSQSDSIAPTYVQRLDDEVRYYFDELPRGSYSFHFRARATSEGAYVEPPPYAELMYHQEVRGRGAGMHLVVTGEHEK